MALLPKIDLQQCRYGVALLAIGGTIVLLAVQQAVRRQRKESKEAAISTWVVSETRVQADPAILLLPVREPLSEVDEWLSRSSHWLGFCLRFDSVLNAEQVQKGLERTLAHIPALGARVDTTHDAIRYELVLIKDNQGVIFEFARGKVSEGATLPDESTPREAWQEAGLDAPAAGFSGEPTLDDPLMRARLTVFETHGVSYLSIGVSHGLGDGHSIADVLLVWSHFCTSDSPDDLPETLRKPRGFGKRVTEPARPAKDMAELERRVLSDIGCPVNPLSKWAFYGHLLPRAILCMSRQCVLELRIHGDEIAALKATVMNTLSQGEWISRFELVCAVLITAQRATSPERALASYHDLFVACDLRGRAKRFGREYFGNAAFDFRESMELPESTTWDLPTLVQVAREIHHAVRTGLQDAEGICRTKDWFEAARHLGLKNTYDIWPIVFDTLRGTGSFVNSWDCKWLTVTMGAQQPARAMAAYFGVLQNLIVQVPRTENDSTVYLALPPQHAKRFVAFCQDSNGHHPPLPFSIV